MALSFLLLGTTTVSFYDATAANRVSDTPPPSGALGALENVSNFFGGADPGEPTPLFTIDVSVAENHSVLADVQSHPIEDGSEITDHVIIKPRRLTIEGTITDTPSGAIAVLAPLTGIINRFAGSPRSIEAFNTIEGYIVAKKLFDVVTGLKVYKNMIIRSFNVPKRAIMGRALNFVMELIQIEIVSGSVVAVTTLDGAAPDAEVGSTVPTVVP
jgi:hypothetical protein